ncbi:MAG TPA: hypothetical protein VFS60_18150, partial [Thermoanaerobaculia bacterium]|nr:hypothetical protein [Thermoanaerobaculia bacterium]
MKVMRGRRGGCELAIVVVVAAVLASTPAARADAQPQPDALRDLRELRDLLQQVHDEAALRPRLHEVALRLGASFSEREAREGRRAFRLTFTWPLPARSLIAAMGWQRPYAVSGDAHQSGWNLRLWTGDVDDRQGPRIATHTPHVGAWAVDASLDDRPAGELPRLASGGSPAYDLAQGYSADVTSLAVELWSDDWQVPDRMPAETGDGAPKLALDDAPIRAWIEAQKGFGYPRYFDSAAAARDMRVLAAWNIPTSGVNWTDFWI